MKYLLILGGLLCSLVNTGLAQNKKKGAVDIIANKGVRSVMPENTVEGMIKALELGVRTLKFEVVISADNQIVVSQEPYFSERISTHPENRTINLLNEKQFNIYRMSYDSLKNYDVGLRYNEDFPAQEKFRVSKPLLSTLIEKVEYFAKKRKIKNIKFIIEPKTIKNGEGIYHPQIPRFIDLVMKELETLGINQKTVLYSFDPQVLQYAKTKYPQTLLALAVDEKIIFEDNIKQLGFLPNYYSAYLPLVGKTLIDQCHANQIKILVWTINKTTAFEQVRNLGVDGILTDKPELFANSKKE